MITKLLRILLTRSFKPFEFTNVSNNDLNLDVPELGIYVHIPFCETICDFCPYNKVKYNKSLAKSYCEALIKEINLVGENNNYKNKITSVYFGGGSPALMIDELDLVVTALQNNFDITCCLAIELHPNDVTKENLTKLKTIGFEMISIGIQSFNKQCLHVLGRTYFDGAKKVRLASDFGFKTIDVDLIFGISGQSKEGLRKDFTTAFNEGATQVSTYPFIDFSYTENKSKPLGRRDKKILLDYLETVSEEQNCTRTAVWTFGKPDREMYSSITRDSFIGFGPSATTLLMNQFKINTFSVNEYINTVQNNKIPTALTLNFTERTRALYWMFWNCYTLRINNKSFKKLFHKDLEQLFKYELKIGVMFGFIKKTSEGYVLTKKGIYRYHLLEQSYTRQYIDKTWKIATKETWPDKIRLY